MSQPFSEELTNALKIYATLASRVKELSSASLAQTNEKQKAIILKQLALAINSFDDQVKSMVKQFPEYYGDKKTINHLIDENANFLKVTLNQINVLTNSNSN